MPLSKSQIDRVGERLKHDDYTEDDLRLLDQHRRSYGPGYMSVVRTIEVCGELPTGRPAKSTASIAEKLRRESIRLSQMQDIAGCRVVVKTIAEQARLVQTLFEACPGATVVDRRNNPSNGYRAVHIIARVEGKPIEIQVRTELQQMWAEVSERTSDAMGSSSSTEAARVGGGSSFKSLPR